MKNLNLKHLFGAACAIALLGASLQANAQTAAETQITNLATLTFSSGGTGLTLESSAAGNSVLGASNGESTAFMVDARIDLQVVEANTDWNDLTENEFVSAGQTGVIIEFDVTNQSNTVLDFNLELVVDGTGVVQPAGYSDSPTEATAWTVTPTLFVDNDDDGYEVTDTDTFIDELAAGATRSVFAVFDVPATAVQDEVEYLTLIAQAYGTFTGVGVDANGIPTSGLYVATPSALGTIINQDSNNRFSPGGAAGGSTADVATNLDLVFADDAGDSQADFPGGANFTTTTAANIGQHADTAGVRVNGARLSVSKTATTIWDPVNANSDPKAIPGAVIQYVITITNTADAGGGAADLTTLADATDTAVSFDGGLLDALCTTAGAVPPVTCDDLTGSAYTNFAGSVGVLVGWDSEDVGTVADATVLVASGTAFSGENMTINLATLLDTASGGFDTANGADGELEAEESVTITYNAYIE